jgi:hypothetical protein
MGKYATSRGGTKETINCRIQSWHLFVLKDIPANVFSSDLRVLRPQSTELTRGPPELVQQFRLGVHIDIRTLHVLNLIWFG